MFRNIPKGPLAPPSLYPWLLRLPALDGRCVTLLGCGVVWCGVVWCGVMWCNVMWCDALFCSVLFCSLSDFIISYLIQCFFILPDLIILSHRQLVSYCLRYISLLPSSSSSSRLLCNITFTILNLRILTTWMTGGTQLWDAIKSHKPTILTGTAAKQLNEFGYFL